MANLAIFKPPELYKKKSEVNYLFTFELRKRYVQWGTKKFCRKLLFRSAKIDCKYSIIFETGTITEKFVFLKNGRP